MKRLVIALSAALVACLVVIAFLAGRMSAPAPASTTIGVREAPVAAVIEPVPAREPAETKHAETKRVEVSSDETKHVETKHVETKPAETKRARENASDVHAYFTRIKQFQALTAGGDPQSYATELMAGASQGDTSGFDKLLSAIEAADREVRAITPPEPCSDYHRALKEMTAESRDLIKGMRDALASGNLDQLAAIGARAQAMQSRVETMEQMERAILAAN